MKNKLIVTCLLLLTAVSVVLAFALKDILLRELSKGMAIFFVLLALKQLSPPSKLKEQSS